MTNEEKAQEISEICENGILQAAVYLGSLEMAEWKDVQFKEYLIQLRSQYSDEHKLLVKNIKKYNNYFERVRMAAEAQGKVNLINKIINELWEEQE